VSTFLTIT